jgi:hypothetical protein
LIAAARRRNAAGHLLIITHATIFLLPI